MAPKIELAERDEVIPDETCSSRYQATQLPVKRRTAVAKWLKRHLAFLGPGMIASVAYIDVSLTRYSPKSLHFGLC